jgi:hypothetical protein
MSQATDTNTHASTFVTCPTATRVIAKFLKMLDCDAATDELERAAIVLAGIMDTTTTTGDVKSVLKGAGSALHKYASAHNDTNIIKDLIRGFTANLSTKHAIRYACIILGYMGKDIDTIESISWIMYRVGGAIAEYETVPALVPVPATAVAAAPAPAVASMPASEHEVVKPVVSVEWIKILASEDQMREWLGKQLPHFFY